MLLGQISVRWLFVLKQYILEAFMEISNSDDSPTNHHHNWRHNHQWTTIWSCAIQIQTATLIMQPAHYAFEVVISFWPM